MFELLEALQVQKVLDNWTTNLVILIVTVLAGFVYNYLQRPIFWTKEVDDVGFEYLEETDHYKKFGKSKRDLVNEVQRRRNIGDLPPVYPNGWFALLESSFLKAGQVKHVQALGENFAVMRSSEGTVHVLDAYCPHLGANMAVGGVVRGDCLECPFHGWQFRGEDGSCTNIPYSDRVPKSASVKIWSSVEANNIIFVWYHAEGVPPSWHIEHIPLVEGGELVLRGRAEFHVKVHMQSVMENAADTAHFCTLHGPAILAGGQLRRLTHSWHRFLRHDWDVSWKACSEPGEEHVAATTLDHHLYIFNKFKAATFKGVLEMKGPSYLTARFDPFGRPVYTLSTVTPLEPLLQKLVYRVYCPPTPLLKTVASIILYCEIATIQRDISVWNSKKNITPLLLKEEEFLLRFRRWFEQFYSKSSPRFSFQKESIDF